MLTSVQNHWLGSAICPRAKTLCDAFVQALIEELVSTVVDVLLQFILVVILQIAYRLLTTNTCDCEHAVRTLCSSHTIAVVQHQIPL